jgi:VanZ family protein
VRYSVSLRAGLSYLFSLLAAVFDEIHQAFVPGRAFQFTDLLYDSVGMIFGCGGAVLLFFLYQKTNQKKSKPV